MRHQIGSAEQSKDFCKCGPRQEQPRLGPGKFDERDAFAVVAGAVNIGLVVLVRDPKTAMTAQPPPRRQIGAP